ncbi:predicted protein [Histoplasma capsulatum H143]|uniref:Uncharacterized protein n=1 Tax=Ajellomyces capsulatus (strain H143) TaxID=544712 RepID=C6H1X8_AJECH|nr:predicted protein [Histoplasma capsulatum H143]
MEFGGVGIGFGWGDSSPVELVEERGLLLIVAVFLFTIYLQAVLRRLAALKYSVIIQHEKFNPAILMLAKHCDAVAVPNSNPLYKLAHGWWSDGPKMFCIGSEKKGKAKQMSRHIGPLFMAEETEAAGLVGQTPPNEGQELAI